MHHFSGADGASPNAGVIQGLDGRLYGTTTNGGAFGYGTVFVMNVTGGLTTLHAFALSDGANPVSELFQASDGAFYGAARVGGPKDGGVIFRVRLDTSPADVYYELVSRNSGKCLDVSRASTDAAASVIQWTCHGGENQQWRLEPTGGGAFRIIVRHSGQVLDVYGALLDDVTPIIQWPAHGGDNQAWTLQPASDGYVSIVARHSGKVLDVEFASPDDGARVIQYTPHGGANQQWLLRGWVLSDIGYHRRGFSRRREIIPMAKARGRIPHDGGNSRTAISAPTHRSGKSCRSLRGTTRAPGCGGARYCAR